LIEENSTAKNFSSKGVGREEKKGREKSENFGCQSLM